MLQAGAGVQSAPRRAGFTLVELLVVIGILALLMGLLLPMLSSSQAAARKTACLANLRQIGLAIQAYAYDNRGSIPFGPKAPPMMTATDFYPSTGAPTSLISLMNGSPVALGLLLKGYLARQPRVLFCPGSDQPYDADAELASVGFAQAQCSYYYRHGSISSQFDEPGASSTWADHIRLAKLGANRDGVPIRALVIDSMFLCSTGFATFGIKPSTQHQQRVANILYSDGHAVSRQNTDGRYTVSLDTYDALNHAFDRILKVLETADADQ